MMPLGSCHGKKVFSPFRRDFLKLGSLLAILGGGLASFVRAEESSQPKGSEPGTGGENRDKLVVLWTSGDRDVALKMVFMYTLNAKLRGWWKEITLIVWGPSSRLLSHDRELQEYIGKMKEAGVVLRACKACSDSYGVSESLEEQGISVEYMGVPLTDFAKEGCNIMTF